MRGRQLVPVNRSRARARAGSHRLRPRASAGSRSTEATRAFAERIGIVRRTFYGEMWDTKPPATAEEAESIVDTAYTNLELKPHTDGTYWRDPPGASARTAAGMPSQPTVTPRTRR